MAGKDKSFCPQFICISRRRYLAGYIAWSSRLRAPSINETYRLRYAPRTLSMKSLYFSFTCLLCCFAANGTDNAACLSITNVAPANGAASVTLHNDCDHSVVAVILSRSQPTTTPSQPPLDIDFTIGVGFPENQGKTPATVGLLGPGADRTVPVGGLGNTRTSELTIAGFILEDGTEYGSSTLFTPMKRSWRHRLAELHLLDAQMHALRSRGRDDLDVLDYIKGRATVLRSERNNPKATMVEVREKAGGLVELDFEQALATNLLSAINSNKLTRASAAAMFRDVVLSRMRATESVLAQMRGVAQ
jgi:hypothetical protein